jgi:hypothetical protein
MSDPDSLMNRALQLQQGGREAEAIAAYRSLVEQYPDSANAWFNLAMLLQQHNRSGDALDAFASFVTYAGPGSEPFLEFARNELAAAGRPVPAVRSDREGSETFTLTVERDGRRTLVVVENDSGVDPESLRDTLQSFVWAQNWTSAYLILRDHPELLSGAAQRVLEAEAASADAAGRDVYEWNASVLWQVRTDGPDETFAALESMSVQDFRLLVRGIDEIQPVVQRLVAAADDEEAAAILDGRPDVVDDPATDVLLYYLRESNPDSARPTLDWVGRLVESRR